MSWVTVRLSGDMIVSGGVPAPAAVFCSVDVGAPDPPSPTDRGPDDPGARSPVRTPGRKGRPER